MSVCVSKHIKYPMQLFNWLLSPVSWWKKKDAKSNFFEFEENEFILPSQENIVSFPTFLKSNNVQSCNIRNSFFVYLEFYWDQFLDLKYPWSCWFIIKGIIFIMVSLILSYLNKQLVPVLNHSLLLSW